MTILGIDPGTTRIGYGLVEAEAGRFTFREAGILPFSGGDRFSTVRDVRTHLNRILTSFKPAAVSLERIYFAKNRKTGIQVAEMRGVIVSCIIECGVPLYEYSPNEVKSALTGYGFADKKSVLKMVKLILREPDLALLDDASDALAIAIVAGMRKGGIGGG